MQPAFTEFVRKFPILNHVADALKPYMNTVSGLYFHGSRARGDHREDSDYDLLLITRAIDLTPSYLLTVLKESVPLIGAELREKLLRKKMNDIPPSCA